MKNLQKNKGKVYLVGAGPAEPSLITIRAVDILKSVDCIIYDKLANPQLLEYTKKDAEIIHTPKRVKGKSFTQLQINEIIIEKALKGLSIARLKGGDPGIFGRAGEELQCLVKYDIPFEIVPAVTAGIAAAEYTGIMPTDRKLSSQLMFVTGRLAADKKNEKLDYKLLAEFDGTIIFYMPVAQLETITKNLLKKNINPDTPAVIIQNATTPRQRAVYGCVKNIASKARQENIAPPAVLITGKTAVRKQKFAWFESLPLSGKNIIITRDRKGNSELAKKITTLGGNTVAADTFSFDDLTGKNEFLQTLTETKKCSWVVFTSRNGVKFTFERIRTLGKDARVFGNCKIAAIGEQTSQTLAQYGIKTDLLPSKFTSKQLGRELVNSQNITNKKILLIRSKLADERLVKILKSAKANVIQISAYDLKPLKLDTKQLLKMLENNQIHWITFASPFSAENFFSQIPIETVKKSKTKIASIGPVTSEKLHALGIKVNVQAQEHTINGLLEIMDSNQDLSP